MTVHRTRRACLQAALALPAAVALADATPSRVASLDWGLTQTLIGLGVKPVGVAEKRSYADWVGIPPIPDGVADLGLRTGPSFETLAALRPDLILVNDLDAAIAGSLARIAPTFASDIFGPARQPLTRARDTARRLGDRLGRPAEAAALVAGADAAIGDARARLAGRARRPVLPLSAVDGRHVTLFGAGSLYHDVLVALALPVAPVGPTSIWGHRVAGVADIATLLPADLLVIAPVEPPARRMLDEPGLWQSLLAAHASRAIPLPPAWAYGDVGGAGRFATDVAAALADPRT